MGAQIGRIRKQHGMTQTSLAANTNISLSMVKKVEKGVRFVTTATLGQIAEALGVETARLAGSQDSPEQLRQAR